MIYVTSILLVILIVLVADLHRRFNGHKHLLSVRTRFNHEIKLPPEKPYFPMTIDEIKRTWEGDPYYHAYFVPNELYNKTVEERDQWKKAFEDQLQQFTDYAKGKGIE